MRTLFLILLLGAYTLSCSTDSTPAQDSETAQTAVSEADPGNAKQSPVDRWLTGTADAHQVDHFHAKDLIQFDLELYFRGNKRFGGTITSRTNSREVLLEREDGVRLYYDGSEVWKAPAGAEWNRARFDALTWQYFALAPYKFSDPGTHWELLNPQQWGDKEYQRARLTFSAGTGDAPDDWYIAYTRPGDQLLHALAYVVTYGGRKAEDAEPHAITYTDYRPVDGIPFAHRWEFWMWTEEGGLGEQLGEGTISNVRFFDRSENLDFPLAEAEAVPLPES